MFLNYLPSEMSAVVGTKILFAFFVGVIKTAIFKQTKGIQSTYIQK